ncbi:hypothetical protein SK3146_05462 [Paenibacillus konkukensis]|uniref:Prolow-density lipoprotein receptor-related protein 1-like beta-propeller domain-containing protein n=1 Tax=Paenibacillus konkukensis TaxID=2020716 RepID=A0ABY4RWG9_9BACL|nr:DUF5050 domain-containing protein [Paenibacillus konkukensis]UQZ86170.1 hypothetical protein SK3146_05462 [Paenibacillus konkukensis]
MGKRTLSFTTALTIGLGLALSPAHSNAAEPRVSVALPDFVVKLNGNLVENQYRQYPLLVYKDITYVPMTWYDSRLLGLETSWSQNSGLAISKGDVSSSYAPYPTEKKNPGRSQAKVPNFAVTINGRAVNNAAEPYPLLSYNDIIYFPLTWKFAHDEFGWDYEWSDAEGLAIRSGNLQTEAVKLPPSAGDNGVALFQGHYYFVETEGTTNRVYRTPERDSANKQLVYSYDGDSSYGFNKRVSFWTQDNELWFSYHVGGAIMGSDVYCKVSEDGKASVEHRGYLDFKRTSRGTLMIDQSVPPGGNNLSLVREGGEERDGSHVGDPGLIYGWHVTMDEGSDGYGGDDSTTVVGDDVYVMGSPYPIEQGKLNRIYRINPDANQTEPIVSSAVTGFKVMGGKLYYVKEQDHLLYRSELNGSGETQLSDHPVARWYGEWSGQVYYTAAEDGGAGGAFRLYQVNPEGEDSLVMQDAVESVQFADGVMVCKLADGADYGIKLLDAAGHVKMAFADHPSSVFTDQHTILYVSAEDQSVKRIELLDLPDR